MQLKLNDPTDQTGRGAVSAALGIAGNRGEHAKRATLPRMMSAALSND